MNEGTEHVHQSEAPHNSDVMQNTEVENHTTDGDIGDQGSSSSDEDGMMSFTIGQRIFHKQLIESMESYMPCLPFQEQGRVQIQARECQCVKYSKEATVAINDINLVLGAFARVFFKAETTSSNPRELFRNFIARPAETPHERSRNVFHCSAKQPSARM